MSDLIKELEAVINRHSVENESDTPDFLLATYLSECLKTWAKVVKARDDWYGFKPFGTDDLVTTPTKVVNKLFLYEPGFVGDSVIYEITLKEVARLKKATVDEVNDKMDELGVRQVVIDAANPTIIERIKLRRHVKQLFIRPPIKARLEL